MSALRGSCALLLACASVRNARAEDVTEKREGGGEKWGEDREREFKHARGRPLAERFSARNTGRDYSPISRKVLHY